MTRTTLICTVAVLSLALGASVQAQDETRGSTQLAAPTTSQCEGDYKRLVRALRRQAPRDGFAVRPHETRAMGALVEEAMNMPELTSYLRCVQR